MTAAPGIDFDAIGATADLQTIIAADLGPPARGHKWRCPFHDDHTPSLTLTPDRRHWRCWSCNAGGDVFDWLMRRENVDLVEAVRRIDPTAVDRDPASERQAQRPAARPSAATPPKAPEKPVAWQDPAWQDPAWQAAVDRIVAEAEAELWAPGGRAALDWIRSRGLQDHVIRRFRLGVIPRDFNSAPIDVLGEGPNGEPRRIWSRRGITLPWIAPGEYYASSHAVAGPGRWVGCNVRRLAADVTAPLDRPPKCMALAGSVRGYLYPWADVLPTQGVRPALLVEGELDALLGEQEAGHLVFAGTVGGASQTPDRSALVSLARCPWWLLALDHDGPGVEAARAWRDRAPHKSHRLLLPHGKDLGEFVEAGGDVREWLLAEGMRIGQAGAAQ